MSSVSSGTEHTPSVSRRRAERASATQQGEQAQGHSSPRQDLCSDTRSCLRTARLPWNPRAQPGPGADVGFSRQRGAVRLQAPSKPAAPRAELSRGRLSPLLPHHQSRSAQARCQPCQGAGAGADLHPFSSQGSLQAARAGAGATPPLTHTVVADAAVRGTGRAEDLTRVAVLELHDLVVDLEVLNPRGWALTLWHGAVGGL